MNVAQGDQFGVVLSLRYTDGYLSVGQLSIVVKGFLMPNKSAKFSSEYISKEQMHGALLALPDVLKALLGEHQIVACYGWATKIHSDLMYQPMRDDTRWIQYLIEDSIEQRIVVPGESDFRFEVPEGRLDLLFCHECDIHLDGSDDDLLSRFMSSMPFAAMNWQAREEVENGMT